MGRQPRLDRPRGGPRAREVDDGQRGRRHRHPATREACHQLLEAGVVADQHDRRHLGRPAPARRRGATPPGRRTGGRPPGPAAGRRARRPRAARSPGCARRARRAPARPGRRAPRATDRPRAPDAARGRPAAAGGRARRPTSPTCRAAAGSGCPPARSSCLRVLSATVRRGHGDEHAEDTSATTDAPRRSGAGAAARGRSSPGPRTESGGARPSGPGSRRRSS